MFVVVQFEFQILTLLKKLALDMGVFSKLPKTYSTATVTANHYGLPALRSTVSLFDAPKTTMFGNQQ